MAHLEAGKEISPRTSRTDLTNRKAAVIIVIYRINEIYGAGFRDDDDYEATQENTRTRSWKRTARPLMRL
jgi:hypothetical protein